MIIFDTLNGFLERATNWVFFGKFEMTSPR